MRQTRQFEFRAYPGDENGATAVRPTIEVKDFEEKVNATSYGGRMAKRVNGPVDIAFAGDEPWEDRYITTASPSSHHITGFRFERLEN